MIRLLIVADGPRDAATVPRLVERILDAGVAESFRAWMSIRANGYARKLLFATRVARDAALDGLVITLDADQAPRRERLRELQQGRDADRARAAGFPTALGEAVPHAEAWLLDDPVAVSASLGLAADVEIPSVRTVESPKQTLELLVRRSGRVDEHRITILADIARRLHVGRCTHAKETGFKSFVDDVRREIGPLAAKP